MPSYNKKPYRNKSKPPRRIGGFLLVQLLLSIFFILISLPPDANGEIDGRIKAVATKIFARERQENGKAIGRIRLEKDLEETEGLLKVIEDKIQKNKNYSEDIDLIESKIREVEEDDKEVLQRFDEIRERLKRLKLSNKIARLDEFVDDYKGKMLILNRLLKEIREAENKNILQVRVEKLKQEIEKRKPKNKYRITEATPDFVIGLAPEAQPAKKSHEKTFFKSTTAYFYIIPEQ